MKNWYNTKNLTATTAKISIHNEIGYGGISASEFINEIQALGNVTTIELHIHSPGGNLLDGLAIYSTLRNHPAKVLGHVDGLAASAASIILMAADRITMPEDAYLMIHNAQGGAFGDAAELRDMAALMEKLQGSAADIYVRRTGLDRQTILDMMAKESWLSATEAKTLGFCDEVIGRVGLAAKSRPFDHRFKMSPMSEPDFDEVENERDFERLLRDLHFTKREATAFVSRLKNVVNRQAVDNADDEIVERLENLKIPKSILN
ncbi:head maturation protease, ClpP-related [Methylomonas sp. MK1]|uniref:head maturation protease, ClpP-related n=1 Tax=Methylomonas sp. MK1 TaxID=1131552 RepID=UPI00036335AB|nr:head maturation protease, ClpP-related [Methylomonas sp. MK1]